MWGNYLKEVILLACDKKSKQEMSHKKYFKKVFM